MSGKMGRHEAKDFQEERILRHLLLKGRCLGQRHVPPHRPSAKTVYHSQGHTWPAWVAMAQSAPWPLKTLLGVGTGLDWKRPSLQVWKHLLQRCCAFWHHYLPGP